MDGDQDLIISLHTAIDSIIDQFARANITDALIKHVNAAQPANRREYLHYRLVLALTIYLLLEKENK